MNEVFSCTSHHSVGNKASTLCSLNVLDTDYIPKKDIKSNQHQYMGEKSSLVGPSPHTRPTRDSPSLCTLEYPGVPWSTLEYPGDLTPDTQIPKTPKIGKFRDFFSGRDPSGTPRRHFGGTNSGLRPHTRPEKPQNRGFWGSPSGVPL